MKSTENEKKEYQQLVNDFNPKSNISQNCIRAFLVGGFICIIGQFVTNTLTAKGFDKQAVGFYTSSALILMSIVLTYFGVFDEIGKFAGAGSGVPITGFANAIASAAIEFKREGFILGMGAKIFIVAGPVILYGLVTSVFVGFFYYLFSRWQ